MIFKQIKQKFNFLGLLLRKSRRKNGIEISWTSEIGSIFKTGFADQSICQIDDSRKEYNASGLCLKIILFSF